MGSIFQNILNEANQGTELRKPLLKGLRDHYSRFVLSFYTTFGSPKGAIADPDVDVLRDILKNMDVGQKLLLIIDSPGGDPLAAERFIKVCREFSGNDYWVIIPGKAKSAATMIALGSSKLIMTNTSEIGPIDIQVPWGDDLVAAHIIITAYEELLEKGLNLPPGQRIEPILQQLQVFNAPQIERWRMARDLSKEIARKVLKEGMFLEIPEDEANFLLEPFINPQEMKDHGRPVFFSDIKGIDKNERFKVDLLEQGHLAHDLLHEYHMRVKYHMSQVGLSKLFETETSAFTL